MIKYRVPENWIEYNRNQLVDELIEAKASVLSLTNAKYQRSWIEDLQKLELKREIAGTSKIEGADFTDKEFEDALKYDSNKLLTRSQRQAHAAMETYKFIEKLGSNIQINEDLIYKIHSKMIENADDDHCAPGKIRTQDHNVIFGRPRHRGAEGGKECELAFNNFIQAINHEYKKHDPLIQSLAAHYHFAAMHPFNDGNGRTGRALESLILQKAGLKLTFFISMSNYYSEEKEEYLDSLSAVRKQGYDLSPFLKFCLRGIALQCQRLLQEINYQVSKSLFRDMMVHLFDKLETPHKRVIAERQREILNILLESDSDEILLRNLIKKIIIFYNKLKFPLNALVRDIAGLEAIGALKLQKRENKEPLIRLRLEWPTEITETDFFAKLKSLPTAKKRLFSTQ